MELEVIPISSEFANFQCTLTRIGPFLVLFDCGGREDFLDVGFDCVALQPYVPFLDVVVLSQATFQHLGAYPSIFPNLQDSCRVVCTETVRHMGELALLSLVEDSEKYKVVRGLDTDAILRAFMSKKVVCLKFTEAFIYRRGEDTLKLVPRAAGGKLGSAYWSVEMGASHLIYAVDYAMREGRYVGGLDSDHLLGVSDLKKATVLLTSAPVCRENVPHLGLDRAPASSKTLETASGTAAQACLTCAESYFLERTIRTLKTLGGTVIVPIDATGASLDVLLLLDDAWNSDASLADKFPICWVSALSDIILDQVKTRMEWMSPRVQKLFEERPEKRNPFMLANVRLYPSIDDLHLHVVPQNPKVVVASSGSLENGDARELLFRYAQNENNLVWLTQPWYPADSLGDKLFNDFVIEKQTAKEYPLKQHVKLPLSEKQLRDFYAKKCQEEEEEKMAGVAQDDGVAVKEEEEAKKSPEEEAQGIRDDDAHPREFETFFEPQGWYAKTRFRPEIRKECDDYGAVLTEEEKNEWRRAEAQSKGEDFIPVLPKDYWKRDFKFRRAEDRAFARRGEFKGFRDFKFERRHDDRMFKRRQRRMLEMTDQNQKNWLQQLRIRFKEPMRAEIRNKILAVKCKVLFCTFSVHDARDARQLITKLEPMRVVLLPTKVADNAANALRSHFTDGLGRDIVAEVHRLGNQPLALPWRIRKRAAVCVDPLFERIKFVKTIGNTRVAVFQAKPACDEEDARRGCFTSLDEGEDILPTLLICPPKLSLFRAALKKRLPEGSRVTFLDSATGSAKPLDVNGQTRLHSSNDGIVLEGCLSEEFYTVRSAIYDNCVAV